MFIPFTPGSMISFLPFFVFILGFLCLMNVAKPLPSALIVATSVSRLLVPDERTYASLSSAKVQVYGGIESEYNPVSSMI